MTNFGDITLSFSDSNLETGRYAYDHKTGVSQPFSLYIKVNLTLRAVALRSSYINREEEGSLPLPDLSRKIEGPLLVG